MSDVLPDDLIETKGEFARRINVSAGRVSQYIGSGQIGPEALEGEGRSARVRVKTALQHLGMRLDIGQRLGNGIGTRLPLGGEASPAAPSGAVAPTFEAQIQREKLEDMQRRNRLAARDEAADAGLFTETASVRKEMLSIAAEMLSVFEGALPEVATEIAGRFHIPQRDVLHLLRGVMRDIRSKAAEQARRRSLDLPQHVDFDPALIQAERKVA